jgi:hypothetical protein
MTISPLHFDNLANLTYAKTHKEGKNQERQGTGR